ncbi:MAG: peptidoglycan DD-metalloendopeptidase family protein [Peptostreptococcaceae bacterium]|nr:peptidoglycan DD-metalloendopeptidase family protein [Peptostreptococcaceae bacterium]
MAKKIKRVKKGIELNVKRCSKANRKKYIKTTALNVENPVMPDFGYDENGLREEALHQEALRIKSQIKAEMETNISKKLSKFNETDFDRLWEEQKKVKVYSERLNSQHSFKKEKKDEKITEEKGLKFKTLVFFEALSKVPVRIISKTIRKVKKYYKSHPEHAKRIREKNKYVSERLIILKRNFVARERLAADKMARMIVGIDHRNEELAEKATMIVERSSLKLMLAREYAELNKAKLLIKLVFFLVIATIIAAGFSYVSAYEYSYNGRVLGVVKNQEDVLKLLDVVTEQLTKEYNAEVKIDRKLDIAFERVISVNREIDDSEEVLNKLSYMQDMKVNAFGIYVNDNRQAIISSKETAKQVLESIKTRYINNSGSSEYESVGFAENVEIKVVQTKLGRIQNSEDVLKKILTGAVQTKVHIVEPGDTFSGVSKKYGIKSSVLSDSNPGINPERLSIGLEIVLTHAVPLITVQTVEVATYMEPIAFEKTTEDSSNMYKGEQRVRVKGIVGEKEVVARIIKNNGIELSKTELESTVIEEPVKEVMLVGTKALPSLQGSGTYIYPVVGARLTQRYSSYHRAIDLALPVGNRIRASDGGTVISAGYSGSYGYVVRINHGGNRVTLYAHCSKILVKAGEKVYQGQHIANSGNTGRSTGPHVHFEVIVNGVQKNPLNYI